MAWRKPLVMRRLLDFRHVLVMELRLSHHTTVSDKITDLLARVVAGMAFGKNVGDVPLADSSLSSPLARVWPSAKEQKCRVFQVKLEKYHISDFLPPSWPLTHGPQLTVVSRDYRDQSFRKLASLQTVSDKIIY